MKKRIVSIWFSRLATDRIQRRRGAQWAARPLAAVVEAGNRIMLAGVNRAAEQAGLTPGMTLADARAVAAHLATAPADAGAQAALLARLARWCGRYTPIAAPDGTDGLFLDITGCAHLFGGEADMLADMTGRLEAFGFAVAAALADTPGAAWALAHYGGSGAIAAPGGTARAIERLPVGALRLDRETAASLAHLGLRRIGDLYGIPRGSLAARFDRGTVLLLDRALGHAEEAIGNPRPPVTPRARIAFAEPIGTRADIDAALDYLLGELCPGLEDAGQGARRLELAFHRVDGTAQMLAIGTARPLRDAAALARLFRDRLDKVDPGFGIEAMALTAPAAEPLSPAQATLDERRDAADGMAALVERLGNRFGFERVRRVAPLDSHLPDRAWRGLPADVAPVAGVGQDWPRTPPRPPRLLPMPEPVDAEAGAEAGPPAAFRWRGRRHRVAGAEGPERIAPEWWRDDPAWASGARDYWRIEDETGRRFWLSRTDHPSEWRLHGLFG
jgi:protein ImuB